MNLSELKVLVIDDSVYKAMDITRALEFSGIRDVLRVRNQEAGFKLIERLKEEKLDIPVIICSSRNYTEPKILGSVWFNELSDLNREFREVLKKL